MGETIEQLIMRVTGRTMEEILKTDRKELIRSVYNGLANDPENTLDHHGLLKESHYVVARFLDGDQSMNVPSIGVGDKTYNTFEFGTISKDNCSSDKLLYLVKTYPDLWLKRLV